MKPILFTLFLILPSFILSQELATEPYYKNGKITFQDVRQLPERSKDEMYLAAISWVNSYFENSKAVIQSKDKNAGRLILKGNFLVHTNRLYHGRAEFILTLEFKEGRYRYTFTNFRYILNQPNNFVDQPFEDPKPANTWMGWWRDAHDDLVDKMFIIPDDLFLYLREYSSDSDW